MPRGLKAVGVLLGTCVVTLGITYAATRPGGEAAREFGSAPVRVPPEPAYEAPRLGRAVKLPALAQPPAPPKPVPTRAEPAEATRSVVVDRPRPSPPASEPYVPPPAPVTPPAQPTPSTPVYEPPPPPPPPPTQEPEVLVFDDSG